LPHQPRFGVAGSSGPVLDITGVDGVADGGGIGARSLAMGAGSRIVERRRGDSCAFAAAAGGSIAADAGRCSIGGA
jgi:hypothetical protein